MQTNFAPDVQQRLNYLMGIGIATAVLELAQNQYSCRLLNPRSAATPIIRYGNQPVVAIERATNAAKRQWPSLFSSQREVKPSALADTVIWP